MTSAISEPTACQSFSTRGGDAPPCWTPRGPGGDVMTLMNEPK